MGASGVIRADQLAEVKTPAKNQGTLKADGKEHSLFAYEETESASQGVSKLLSTINEEVTPETPLVDHAFTEITPETIAIETEIGELFEEINDPAHQTPLETRSKQRPQQVKEERSTPRSEKPTKVYSSLFDLASSVGKRPVDSPLPQRGEQKPRHERSEKREELKHSPSIGNSSTETLLNHDVSSTRHEQPRERDHEEEGSGGGQHQGDQRREQKKQRDTRRVTAVSGKERIGIDSIFVRFMALMARILGQAEAEAHDLYLRIKERTDNIDHLTLFISKINSEKGAIDWTNSEEMKRMIEKARGMGVDIHEGKLTWTEDEKRLLKENIQMRKDSMEKMTQLERTDMQRYLQEASQCHQARSNVLKLLKEVVDTIIHNMRGG